MKSILVTVSGTTSDDAVIQAAFAVARPLSAHLDFLHLPLNTIDPSDYNRHIDFARGGGVEIALREALLDSRDALARARAHVANACAAKGITTASSPAGPDQVTASWAANPVSPGIDGLVKTARTHELTVVGRSAGGRNWSTNLLEALAVETGRPVLIVPHDLQEMTLGTIAVWWKDHAAAARAMTAALPLLRVAGRVVLISVAEEGHPVSESVSDLCKQLAWQGISASVEIPEHGNGPTDQALWSASLGKQADLMIMGGFGRSRLTEMIFGGCTQSVLEAGARPVFMLH